MVLGSAYGADIISLIVTRLSAAKMKRVSRGTKLIFQMGASLLTHSLGWLIVIEFSGIILGFSLFRWEVLIWLFIFIIINFIINAVHQLRTFYKELIEKDLAEERLKSLASQAELRALKAQINPSLPV